MMNRVGIAVVSALASAGTALVFLVLTAGSAAAQVTLDDVAWAYAISLPAAQVPDDGAQHSVPGSELSFTRDEIRNLFGPADWFPGDHPDMPRIVAVGREAAAVWACSLCHYPNGKGRPENAPVAGHSKEYFIQQMHDFRDGRRRSAEPLKSNANLMVGFAQAMTETEIEEAAEYFSAMAWTPWIEVVETDSVPKTYLQGGMHLRLEGPDAGMEPIGRRIIESPVSTERTEALRDPRSGFIAYVPVGAVAAGKNLATTGGGKTVQCAICHGESLNGLAAVPDIRGRSPSYIVRQLFDFQQGTRQGLWAPLMRGVVENLSADDMINLAAYLASLPPEG